MPCTEAYKEHIEYTFNAFCRVVIHYAAINAWRDRDKRRQREISFEYLTEEKFYPFCTSDTYFIDPYKQYPVTICGQRVILTNGNLAEALSSLPEKKREIIYLFFFGRYTQQEIGELYGRFGNFLNLHNSIFTIFSNGKIYTATVIKIDDGFFSINEYTNYLVVVVPIPIFWVINYAIGFGNAQKKFMTGIQKSMKIQDLNQCPLALLQKMEI